MKRYATWAWMPPHFELLGNGKVRIYYTATPAVETRTFIDPETEEERTEEVHVFYCEFNDVDELWTRNAIRNKQTDSVDFHKRVLEYIVTHYDASTQVNSFTIGGYETWLDKETRVGLKLRFEAEGNAGIVNTTLWHDGLAFPLEVNTALQMLIAIEDYASASYDNTQRHIAAVRALTTVEEVEAYNYTTGYPEKLVF